MRETFVPGDFIKTIQSALYKPLRNWFVAIFFSASTACGTVSSWILKSNNDNSFRKFDYFVQRLGNEDEKIQNAYLTWIVDALKNVLQNDSVVRLALDDSPIKRRGPKIEDAGFMPLINSAANASSPSPSPKIEGAGFMHDPPNVNDKNAICYVHSFVVLSLVVDHPKWGTLSLPLEILRSPRRLGSNRRIDSAQVPNETSNRNRFDKSSRCND